MARTAAVAGIEDGLSPSGRSGPAPDDFVLTQVRGRLGSKPATFVWIMPGPRQRLFYPVRKTGFKKSETAHPAYECLATLETPDEVKSLQTRNWGLVRAGPDLGSLCAPVRRSRLRARGWRRA